MFSEEFQSPQTLEEVSQQIAAVADSGPFTVLSYDDEELGEHGISAALEPADGTEPVELEIVLEAQRPLISEFDLQVAAEG